MLLVALAFLISDVSSENHKSPKAWVLLDLVLKVYQVNSRFLPPEPILCFGSPLPLAPSLSLLRKKWLVLLKSTFKSSILHCKAQPLCWKQWRLSFLRGKRRIRRCIGDENDLQTEKRTHPTMSLSLPFLRIPLSRAFAPGPPKKLVPKDLMMWFL